MKRGESVESKIINYFSDESLEKVQLLFGIVKGIVSRREPAKKRKVNIPVKDTDPLGLKGQKSNSGVQGDEAKSV